MCDGKYVGAIVCKMDMYSERSGYIAMLAVDKVYRKRKIGELLFYIGKWNVFSKSILLCISVSNSGYAIISCHIFA